MDNAAVHEQRSFTENCGKILADLDFSTAVIHLNTILLSGSWSALKRKVAGCVHLYDSVSLALDAVLEGN